MGTEPAEPIFARLGAGCAPVVAGRARRRPDTPWLLVFPGAATSLTVLGFNLPGDGLHDALDPRD